MKKAIVILALFSFTEFCNAQISSHIPRLPASVFPIGPFTFARTKGRFDPQWSSVHNLPPNSSLCGNLLTILNGLGANMMYYGAEWGADLDDNTPALGSDIAFWPTSMTAFTVFPDPKPYRPMETYVGVAHYPTAGAEWRYSLATDPEWQTAPGFHYETYQLDNFQHQLPSMWQTVAPNGNGSVSEYEITPSSSDEEELRLNASPGTSSTGALYGDLSDVLNNLRAWPFSNATLGQFEIDGDVPADGTNGLVCDFVYRFGSNASQSNNEAYEVQYQLLDQYGFTVQNIVDVAGNPIQNVQDVVSVNNGIISVPISTNNYFQYGDAIEHPNIKTFNGQPYAVRRLHDANNKPILIGLLQSHYHPNQIGQVIVTNGGTGYSSNPNVTITDNAGNGSGASAIAHRHGLIQVTVTGGSKLISEPQITLTYQSTPGKAAKLKCPAWAYCGVFGTESAIIDPGYDIIGTVTATVDPSCSEDGVAGEPSVAVNAATDDRITSIEVLTSGSGYKTPVVAITGGGGMGATADVPRDGSGNPILGGIPTQFVARLVAKNNPPSIFVRGWRFRTVSGDRTLRHKDDSYLRATFGSALKMFKKFPRDASVGVSGTSYDEISVNGTWGEAPSQCYRVMAYIDDLYYNYTNHQIHLLTFETNDPHYYRAVFHDQNGYSPVIDYEAPLLEYGVSAVNPAAEGAGQPDRLWDPISNNYKVCVRPNNYDAQRSAIPTPADVIPAWALIDPNSDLNNTSINHINPNLVTLDYPIADPNHQITIPADLNLATPSSSGQSYWPGYSEYTNNIWNTISTFTGMQSAAEASSLVIDKDVSPITKWFAHVETEWSLAEVDYFPVTDQIRTSILQAFNSGNNYDPRARFYLEPGWDPVLVKRRECSSEIRAQAWDALSHGAKGIFFNSWSGRSGSDMGVSTETMYHYFDIVPTTVPPNNVFPDGEWFGFADYVFGWESYDRNGSRFYDPIIDIVDPDHLDGSLRFTDHWVQRDNSKRLIPILDPVTHAPISSQTDIDNFTSSVGAGTGWKPVYEFNDGTPATSSDVSTTVVGAKWSAFSHSIEADALSHGKSEDEIFNMWHYPQTIAEHFGIGAVNYDPNNHGIAHFDLDPSTHLFCQGYRDRWHGCEQVAEDVNRCGEQLSKLQWQNTVLYPNTTTSNFALCNDQLQTEIAIADGATIYPIGPYMTSAPGYSNSWNGNGSTRHDATSRKVRRFTYDSKAQPGSRFMLATTDSVTHFPTPANEPSDGIWDSPIDTHMELGLFSDPNEIDEDGNPTSYYVTVTNLRSWPILWDTEKNSDQSVKFDADGSIHKITISAWDPYGSNNKRNFLGAVDARQFTFMPIRQKIDPNCLSPYYSIRNIKTGQEWIGLWGLQQPFSIQLEPGEGTLLRLAPATSIELGKTSAMGMAYNNGHRVTDVIVDQHINTPDQQCSRQRGRAVCWEENGEIRYCLVQGQNGANFNQPLPHEPPPDPSGVIPFNVVRTIYPPAGSNLPKFGHNPSIASKPDIQEDGSSPPQLFNDTIAVVFSVDDFDDSKTAAERNANGRYVKVAISADLGRTWTIKTIANTVYTLDAVPDVSGGRSDLHVPVITGSRDGFIGAIARYSYCSTFQVHWNQVTNNWDNRPLASLRTPPAGQRRFPSVASTYDLLPVTTKTPNTERIHFAWEEDYTGGNSAIIYRCIDHTLASSNLGTTESFVAGPTIEVSKDYGSCLHKHPMVVAKGGGSLSAVTWEATRIPGQPNPSGGAGNKAMAIVPSNDNTKPVLREMTAYDPLFGLSTWTPFRTAHPVKNNLPLPVLRVEDSYCSTSIVPPAIPPLKERVYQDTFTRQIFIHRSTAITPPNWPTNNILSEYGQTPGVSMPYIKDLDQDKGSISFRGISVDENGLYSARIIASPPAEKSTTSNIVEYFDVSNAVVPNGSCVPPILSGGSDNTSIIMQQGDSSFELKIPWQAANVGEFVQSQIDDSTATLIQPVWPNTEDSIRTVCFSTQQPGQLDMSRILMLDTTQILTSLPTPSSFISFKLVVKDSASTHITQVLDSVRILGGPPIPGRVYPCVDFNDTTMTGIGYHIQAPILPTPSGKGYITMIVQKDSISTLQFVQNEELGGVLELPRVLVSDTGSDSGAYKRPGPRPQQSVASNPLQIHVYPNPAGDKVTVCEEELTAGLPAVIEVVDQQGSRVALLYNDTPQGDLGFCVTFTTSNLLSGVYYVHVYNSDMGRSVKLSVMH